MNNHEQEIIKLKQLLIERDAQLTDLKQQVMTFTLSLSWRITKPLRWANYQLHMMLQKLRWGNLSPIANVNNRNNYMSWVARYDSIDHAQRKAITNRIYLMNEMPCITLIIPVITSGTMSTNLDKTIQSVQQQLYANWTIILLGEEGNVFSLRQSYAELDSRIQVIFLPDKSLGWTIIQELVTSEWVTFLWPGDLLAEHALLWIVDCILTHAHLGLIYSDEDCIDEVGLRKNPYFKPEWNYDLLLSHNYISNLCVLRVKLIHKLNFSGELSSVTLYHLILRIASSIEKKQIAHIARVLYHRKLDNNKADNFFLEKEVLEHHLASREIVAKVSAVKFGCRVHYQLPDDLPLVSVIVPTRNSLYLLRRCIQSLMTRTDYSVYEIIIMDNGSDDSDTLFFLNELQQKPNIRVIRNNEPFNYSALNNQAAQQARGSILCLLNNDTEIISNDWLNEMVSVAILPDVGAVGAKLLYPNETVQHGGIILGIGELTGHSHKHFPRHDPGYQARMAVVSSVSAVTAACLVIRKAIYDEVGGLNANELKVAFNDIDFCLRVLDAGYRNVWTPFAELFHHESATRGGDDTPQKQRLFLNELQYMKARWGKKLTHDPAYNPNLTLLYEDFSLAWPPRVASIQG